MKDWKVLNCDVMTGLALIEDESIHCCVTSPPYWNLRDYGVAGQIGLEPTPDEFVEKMVAVFREVRRVLRKDGTCWINLGDSYTQGGNGGHQPSASFHGHNKRAGDLTRVPKRVPQGLKPKDIVGIPWMVAFALRADGWYLRQDIIWAKPNPMPESVRDRCTKAHEYIFLLSKSERYYYDQDAVREPYVSTEEQRAAAPWVQGWAAGDVAHDAISHATPKSAHGSKFTTGKTARDGQGQGPREDHPLGRNKRSVWEITPAQFSEAHFATFPPELVRPCILAGCPEGGTVLDPFSGAGTTGLVATRHNRGYLGLELNPEYAEMSRKRIEEDAPLFNAPCDNALVSEA